MLTSIRAKLGIVFVGFLLLVAGSVIATFFAIEAQATDALVINLAGRQRMLTQEMTKAVLGIAREPSPNYQAELDETIYLFDRTLAALLDGGETPYGEETVLLPPTEDGAIRTQLETVGDLWARFRQEAETVLTSSQDDDTFSQAVGEIEALSPIILQEMDQAVRQYEAAAGQKVARLRTIQAVFFVSAGGLLIAGYLLTQRTIVTPVSALDIAARRIADGDLDSPVETAPIVSGEIRTLSQSFESMRQELASSHLELEQWAAEIESRVERRTEQLATLFEVSTEISSKLEIPRVLELAVEKTCHLVGGEVAVLCLLDPLGKALEVATTSGPEEAFVAHPPKTMPVTTPVAACATEAARHQGHACPLLQPEFRRSHLAIPLAIGERVLGILCVGHREESRFSEEETRLLTLLANAEAIALENARLYEQVEHTATLAERERIVAEIHDGLAQTLSFISLRLGAVEALVENRDIAQVPEHLALMQRTVDQANQEVRRLMNDLQTSTQAPPSLDELLKQTVEDFTEEREIEVEFQSKTEQPLQELPHVYEQIMRIVLEALTNVHKHAGDSRATVTLGQSDGQSFVCVQDYGPGFDGRVPADGQHHFGLKVMETRAERIGGELSIESVPGQGTTITLRWPTMTG
jgi:two-component system nitrate/nitrite sensor histidine kinase NarX